MTAAPFTAPSAWSNQNLILYHGTVDAFAAAILSGVNVSLCRPRTDFGRGFYTTTVLHQAQTWAMQTARLKAGTAPAVIGFEVSRDGWRNWKAYGSCSAIFRHRTSGA